MYPQTTEQSRRERLAYRGQSRRGRGPGEDHQSNSAVMQPQYRAGEEHKLDQHQPSCNVPPGIVRQSTRLLGGADLIKNYEHYEHNADNRDQSH